MKYIRHIVSEMDESLIQHCILCSEVIANYQNVHYIGEPPKGFAAGPVYITNGNPKFFTTSVDDNDVVIDCMNPLRN